MILWWKNLKIDENLKSFNSEAIFDVDHIPIIKIADFGYFLVTFTKKDILPEALNEAYFKIWNWR